MTSDASLLMEPFLKILMVAMRVTPLWMFFPIFSNSTIPFSVRLAGGLSLSVALMPLAVPHLPAWHLANLPGNAEILYFVAHELCIGAGMGLAVRWIFSSCVASAQWVGMQIGFSMAGAFNHDLGSDSSWAEFNNWIFVMVFFAVGGHYFMLQAIAESYSFNFANMFARLADTQMAAEFWTRVGTDFFFWMLKLSGPLVAVLLVLQAALGILSKFIPQINMWAVSTPLMIALGVFVFAMLSPLYGDALKDLVQVNTERHYMWMRYLGAR